MKKIFLHPLLCFSLILFLASTCCAQLGIVKRPKLALGANFIYAMPQGKFSDAYKFGVGGEVYGGVGLGSTYLLASIGITGYQGQSNVSTLTAVPIKAGLKKYFLLKKIFLNGDVGVSTIKVSNSSASTFTAGFGAGVRLLGLEAALYYNTFKNNVGYSTTGYSNNLQAKIGWGLSL